MRLRLVLVPLLLIARNASIAAEPEISDRANVEWKQTASHNEVVIYSRLHPGSRLKEFKAVGDIAASPARVHQVIDDVDAYPAFMPYVSECRVIKRDGDSLITYQRVSPKICSDRDYALRITEKTSPGPAGLSFLNQWTVANEFAPPKKNGVIRISLCQGAWWLEPAVGNTTHATYSIYTDTGGLIPAFLANHFSQGAIERIFGAIRQRVRDAKYDSAAH